jgi:hypothetical protein
MVILAHWLQINGCHCEGIPNGMTEQSRAIGVMDVIQSAIIIWDNEIASQARKDGIITSSLWIPRNDSSVGAGGLNLNLSGVVEMNYR